MLTRYVLPLFLAIPIMIIACESAAEDESSALMEMVLQAQDVPANFAPSTAEAVSKDFFAAQLGERYGMPGRTPDGWLAGYLSSFLDHPAYITSRVDLFRTSAQAGDFLAAPLEPSVGRPLDVPALGEEALAYPVRADGCPCIIRFRQGNAVAEVYYEGPRATGELEDTLGLAHKVEGHIAEAPE
jgi:hypothetical protein